MSASVFPAARASMNFSQARRQASPVMSVWRDPEVVPESGEIQVLLRS